MKSSELLQLLKDNKGSHLYSIYIASLQKEVSFKPITVGQQLTLSKLAIENENNFYKASTLLIKELCSEELDFDKLNELDRIVLLVKIKKANSLKSNLYVITCPHCSQEFTKEIDYEDYIKNYDKIDMSEKTITINIFDLKYDITVGFPSLNEIIYKQDNNLIDQEDIMHNLFNFIRSIVINNNKLEDLDKLTIEEQKNLYNELPGEILTEISKVIVERYENTLANFMKNEFNCIKCEKKIVDKLDINSFFLN